MACSKYNLTNTGSTIVTFNYQRCDDTLWEYQVELDPGQTKNIWVIDGTYFSAPLYSQQIVLVNEGVFPPAITPTPSHTPTVTPTISQTPTNTPTPSVTSTITPTVTSTQTPTPTQTPTITPTLTQTPTPTNVVRTTLSGLWHSETSSSDACGQTGTATQATIFVNGTNLSDSTLAWSDAVGPNTGDPVGFYIQDNIIYEVAAGCGSGCITGATVTVYGNCPTVTPTQTPTNTPTPSVTPTASVTPTISVTPTQTPTPTTTVTPTNARFSFSVYTGVNLADACNQVSSQVTIWGDNSNFDQNAQFYDSATGPVTSDMTGFYNYNHVVTELDSSGAQQGAFSLCPTLTPTPTVTPTNTPTVSVTPTITPTPTQTIGYFTYSLGFDVTGTTEACSNYSSSPTDYFAPLAGGPGPNVGEFLYSDSGLTTPVSNGYYSNGVAWYLVSGGSGEITSVDPNGC